jgi:hypothetical protein
MVSPGQPLNFNCWVSFKEKRKFWANLYHDGPEAQPQPVGKSDDWSLTVDTSAAGARQLNVSLPMNDLHASEDLSQIHSKNKTLFLHCEFYTPDIFDAKNDLAKGKVEDMSIRLFRESAPLIIYKQIKEKKKRKKLHEKDDNKTKEEEKPFDYTKYRPHLLTYLEVDVVQDFTKYDKSGVIPREVYNALRIDHGISAYEPILHLSSFW